MRIRGFAALPGCLLAVALGASAPSSAGGGCADYALSPRPLSTQITETEKSLVAIGDILVTIHNGYSLMSWSGGGADVPQPGTVFTSGYHNYCRLAVRGDQLYAAADDEGVFIFTVTDTLPVLTGSLTESASARGVVVAGNRLVTSRNDRTLLFYDLAGTAPVLVDSLVLPGFAPALLRAAGDLVLVVTTSPPAVRIVDAASAVVIGSTALPRVYDEIAWDGRTALLTDLQDLQHRLLDTRVASAPTLAPLPPPTCVYHVGGTVLDGTLWLTGCDWEFGGVLERYGVGGVSPPLFLGRQPWIGMIREAVVANGRVHQLTAMIFYDPLPCTLDMSTLFTTTLGTSAIAPERLVFYTGTADDSPVGAAAIGNLYAYLTTEKLAIVDISDPASPVMRGSAEHGLVLFRLKLTSTDSLAIVGGEVSEGPVQSRGRLLVYDVADPDTLVLRDTEICQRSSVFACTSERVYTWGLDDRLYVFSIDAQGHLAPLATPTLPGLAGVSDMIAVGDLLLTADDETHDLRFWDFSDPLAPVTWSQAPPHLVYDCYRFEPWPDGAIWYGRCGADQYLYEAMTITGGEPAVRPLWSQQADTGEAWYEGGVSDGKQLVLSGEYGNLVLDVTTDPPQVAGVLPSYGELTMLGHHLVAQSYYGLEVWAPSCPAASAVPIPPASRAATMTLRPNPSGQTVRVEFELVRPTGGSLTIYDVAGRHRRILRFGRLAAGRHALDWDGRDERGLAVGPGVYLVRLDAAGETVSAKAILVKRP